ncbi:MAG: glycosyltransferase family 39 protein [Armatimonadota bacterium]|nr:glycosyltransferase family 39 protein [Armatimonadota bacterium]MCX7776516.1 glycosyltransferase family 39 protein [Armatimonadota bacterium]MDW8024313.1 glycosyltransferase family 39 protein [Armatimonadota bacterium]
MEFGGVIFLSRFSKTLLLLTLLSGLCVRLAIAWQPWDWLIRTGSFGDDACYYAAIAFNIANGNGPTTDGIHMTNGFQPLWAFMLVPIYALGTSKESAINIAMTTLALLSTLTGLVLFLLAKQLWDERVALWTAFFWMTSPTVLRQSLNGMETGLYVFMLSVAALLVVRHSSNAKPAMLQPIAIGFVLSLIVLSRIDGLPFAIAGMIACAAGWAKQRRSNSRQPNSLKGILQFSVNSFTVRIIAISVAFALPLFPWFAYSITVVGKVIPESGEAVRCLSLAYIGAVDEGITWRVLRYSFAQAASTLLRAQQWNFIKAKLVYAFGSYGAMLFIAALLLLALLISLWLFRVGYFHEVVRMLRGIFKLWFWIFHAGIVILVYSLYQFGWWFFPRYFFVATPLGIIVGSVLAEALRLSMEKLSCRRRLRHISTLSVVAIVLLQLVQLYVGWHYMQVRAFGGFEEYLNVALWLKEHTPKDARIGMFQSGTASYLSERTVINLDGVVNGDALKAMLDKQMLKYVVSQGITYIADWEELIQTLLIGRSPEGELSRWRLIRLRAGEMSVYKLVRGTQGG